jgi:hypothetical protein
MALAVPVFGSFGLTKPTGRFCALETGLNELPPLVLTRNDTFAFVMSPLHSPVFITVALNVKVAVLLVELVVQNHSDPE